MAKTIFHLTGPALTMANDKLNFLIEYSKFLDSSGRHLTYSAISTYRNFGAELSEKEKAFLRNHIALCDACSARLKEIEEIEEGQAQSQRKYVLRMIPAVYRYSIAAAIVVSVGIATAFYLTNRPSPSPDPLSERQSLIAQELDPAKLVPNEMLENFVGMALRSGSDVSFLIPEVGDTLAAPFTFRWDDQKRGRSYKLTVVDNRNAEVWDGSTTSGEIEFTTDIEPGLYYAKLEADGALVRVAKFILIRRPH